MGSLSKKPQSSKESRQGSSRSPKQDAAEREALQGRTIRAKITVDLPEGASLKVTLEAQEEARPSGSDKSVTLTLGGEDTRSEGATRVRAQATVSLEPTTRIRRIPIVARFSNLRLWLLQLIPSAEHVVSSVRAKLGSSFLLGCALILGALYLLRQGDPIIHIQSIAGRLNSLFRIDVPNLDNSIVSIALLLVGGLLVIRASSTSLYPDLELPDRRVDKGVLKDGLSRLLRLLVPALLLFGYLIWQLSSGHHPLLAVPIWIASLALTGVAMWLADRRSRVSLSPDLRWRDILFIAGLLILGFAVGTFRLGSVPQSLVGDEGAFWEAAKAISTGDYRPEFFGFGVYSYPILSSIYQGWILKLFGLTLWSWRFASVLAAVAAVIPTYLLARELFDRRLAVLAGALMVTLPYFIAFERLGYNNSQALFPVALTLYLLYAGFKRGSLLYLFLAGVASGLGFYTYPAARLGLVVASLFIVILLGEHSLAWIRRHGSSPSASRSKPGLILMLVVPLLVGWTLTTLPHLTYGRAISPSLLQLKTSESLFPNVEYAEDLFPADELFRDHPPIALGGETFFYRPDLYARLLTRGLLRSFLVFQHPELVTEHYIWGPLASTYGAGFVILGLALSLAGLRRKSLRLISLWFLAGVFLLSVINTFPPRHQHMVSVLPALAILIALGITLLGDFIASHIRGHQPLVAGALAAAGFIVIAATNLQNYFVDVQARYIPDFENQMAFAVLELKSPRTVIYVTDDPSKEDFIPWIVSQIPNQADFHTVTPEELRDLTLDPAAGYTLFFQEQNQAEVLAFLTNAVGQEIIPDIYLNREGQALGMSYSFGRPDGEPSATHASPGGRAFFLPIAVLLVVVAAYLGLRQLGLLQAIRRAAARKRRSEPMAQTSSDTTPSMAQSSGAAITAQGMQTERAEPQTREQHGRRRIGNIPWQLIKPRPSVIETSVPAMSPWGVLGELALAGLIVLALSAPFLSLDPNRILTGNEFDVVTFLDHVVVNAVQRFGEFPIWNFQLRTGQPLVGDPFMHAFNPVSSLPMMVWGVVDGFKVAVFVSMLLAAIGQWFLGHAMGFNRPVRVWGAVTYALNGQAVARFLQGSYIFTLSYTWLPFIFAGTVLSLRTRQARYYVLTAASLAMLFFSGNAYYSYYMAIILVLFTVIVGQKLGRHRMPVWSLPRLKPMFLIGALAVGFAAVQWLPTLEFWPYIQKMGDPELTTSQPLSEALKDYLSPSTDRPVALETLPPEEFYGYIGVFPFVAAPLALLALWQGWRRKEILAWIGLAVLTVTWICVRYTPFAAIYRRTPFLYQFRYPSRIMVFGSLAVIALAGIGLTWLMGALERWRVNHVAESEGSQWDGARVLHGVLILAMSLSALNVFLVNRRLVGTRERFHEADSIVGWLAAYDPSLHYVSIPVSSGWHLAAASHDLWYWDAWYGYDFFPPGETLPGERPLNAQPQYLVLGRDRLPPSGEVTALMDFDNFTVYALEESLPLSFAVSDATLSRVDLGEVQRSEVLPLQAIQQGPNELLVQADLPDETLWVVALTSNFPGWQVTVDGKPGELEPLGHYLAVRGIPGSHQYIFRYESMSFRIGLAITIASVMLVLALFLKHLYSPVPQDPKRFWRRKGT